ncbi:caspase family protein [Nitrobacter winogradskyi]|uniref:Caspase-like protein n=2 Tax=Nitrobacter winogradskyi TaxID=913 RepID=A0ACC6AIS9_NITWI|nr:caspase family protein [Nitrobacter winogradskyi]MCP1999576.1 putative caspase-like protein [Nitrobacter winogradskyi]GEC17303.1 hypothetical protein NWI01_31950 [Nitrobacter winogradskyi]
MSTNRRNFIWASLLSAAYLVPLRQVRGASSGSFDVEEEQPATSGSFDDDYVTLEPELKTGPIPTHPSRVALVIGNSRYNFFPKLANPEHDATDLAAILRSTGFKVVFGTNLPRITMENAIATFVKNARTANASLVFFAGHGLQYQGVNYLAPVDGQLSDETDLKKFIRLQDVIDDLQNTPGVRILIVDACRDNDAITQLAASAPTPKSRSIGLQRGLAKVEADGIFVAFASQANKVASDGNGRNSPFTASLLKRIVEPGVELRTIMTRVRGDVVTATHNAQRPEAWDSLIGEFTFR